MNLLQITSTDKESSTECLEVMDKVPRSLLYVTDLKALFFNDPLSNEWIHIGGEWKEDKVTYEDNFIDTVTSHTVADRLTVKEHNVKLADKVHVNKEVDVGYDTNGNRLADDDIIGTPKSPSNGESYSWEFENGPQEVTTTTEHIDYTAGLTNRSQQSLKLTNNDNSSVTGYYQQAVSSRLYAVAANTDNRVSGEYFYIRQGSGNHWVIGIDEDNLHLKFKMHVAGSNNRTVRIYKAASSNNQLTTTGSELFSASVGTTDQVLDVDLDKGDYVISCTGSAYYSYFDIIATTATSTSTVEGWTQSGSNKGFSFGNGLTVATSDNLTWYSGQKAGNLGYIISSAAGDVFSLAMPGAAVVTVGFSTSDGNEATVSIDSTSATSTSSAIVSTLVYSYSGDDAKIIAIANTTGNVNFLYVKMSVTATGGSDSKVTLADDTIGNIKALNRVDAKYFKSTNGWYNYTHDTSRAASGLPDWNAGAVSAQGTVVSYANDPASFLHIPNKWFGLMNAEDDNYILLLFPKTNLRTTDTYDDEGNKTAWGVTANCGGEITFKSQSNGRLGHYNFSFSSTGSRSLKGSINIDTDLKYSQIKFPDDTYWYAMHFPAEMAPWDIEFNGYSDIPAELVANIDTYYNYITDDAYKEQIIEIPLTPDSPAGSEDLYIELTESNYTSILEEIDGDVKGLGDDAEPHKLSIAGTLTKPMLRKIATILKLFPERQFVVDLSYATVDTSSDTDKNAQVWDEEFFSKCTSLREFVLPKGVTSIKANVWTWCTYLRKLDLSPSEGTLTSFGMSTWQTKVGPLTSTRVKVLVFPASCYQIGAYTIAYSNLKEVFFKNDTTVFTGVGGSWSSFTLDGLDSGGSDLGDTDGVECRLYISPKVWGDTMNCQGTILTAQQLYGVPALTDDQVVELYKGTLYAEDGNKASKIREWFANNITPLYNAQSTKATAVTTGWGTGWCSAMTHAGNWCGSGEFSSSALNCMCKYFLIYDPSTFDFNRINYAEGTIDGKED